MPPPLALSTPTAHHLSLLFSLTYVGSLYISKHSRLSFSTTTNTHSNKGEWQNGNNQGEREREKEQSERWRDDPDVIRARLLAVLCATTVCCSIFVGIMWAGLDFRWEVRDSPPLSPLPLLTPYKDTPNSPHANSHPPRLLPTQPVPTPTPPTPDNANPLPRTHLLRLPGRSTPLSEELDMGEPCHEEVLYVGGGAELCRCECWMFRFRFLPFHPLLCFPSPSFSFFPTDTNINKKKNQAPITEEIVFRACILSAYHLSGPSNLKMIFLAPLCFGLGEMFSFVFRSPSPSSSYALAPNTQTNLHPSHSTCPPRMGHLQPLRPNTRSC